MSISITADHITYTDSKLPGETDTDRLWFIKNAYPLDDYGWAIVRILSVYWYYKTKLGCSYNITIERKLNLNE
jgi:hypothetical protein